MSDKADPELKSLYLPLYFDEDVSVYVVENLRTRGFDVLESRRAGLLRRDDDEQLVFAIQQQRALVTHNRKDFEERHVHVLETGQKHYGIVIAKRRARDEIVVAKVLELLNTVTAEDRLNQLRYV